MEQIKTSKQKVNFTKVIPPNMRRAECTRCKRPYITYFKEDSICDNKDCFEKYQDRKRGFQE